MPFGLKMSLARQQGKPITCRKCGQGGGTLKNIGDGYVHAKCPVTRKPQIIKVSKEVLARLKGK